MIASQMQQIAGKSVMPAKPFVHVSSSRPQSRSAFTVKALGKLGKQSNKGKVPKQAVKAKYDKSAKETGSPLSAFTRKREVFAGRLAMSGFLAGCIGELLTGKGFIGQLSDQFNLSPFVIKVIIAGIVGFNVLTALNPLSATFSDSNQADVAKRPKGPTQNPKINPIEDPAEFLGIDKGFGFTRKNELFVGRLAMLGFSSALIGEQLTGGAGPLKQIGIGIGQPLNPELAGGALALWIGVALVAALGYGTADDARFLGETDGDKRIY